MQQKCSRFAKLKWFYLYKNFLWLFQSDRSLINLHLMHTSYFLFVMAMTLLLYALLKGRPKLKAVSVIHEKVSQSLHAVEGKKRPK